MRTLFTWEQLFGIPIFLIALSFAGVWFEAEVASDVRNGAIQTVSLMFAPGFVLDWDAAAPPIFPFGLEVVQPSN